MLVYVVYFLVIKSLFFKCIRRQEIRYRDALSKKQLVSWSENLCLFARFEILDLVFSSVYFVQKDYSTKAYVSIRSFTVLFLHLIVDATSGE